MLNRRVMLKRKEEKEGWSEASSAETYTYMVATTLTIGQLKHLPLMAEFRSLLLIFYCPFARH
jgi:hypothetical protein